MKTKSHIALLLIVLFSSGFQNLNAGSGDLVINEVSWSNKDILFDADNDTPDWFELYNKGNESINLAGYQVTDDTTETDYWTFPSYELKAGEYLVVFASGKNRLNASEFHVDFRLSLMQDKLYLIDSDGSIVDEIQAQCVPGNKSLSRKPDGTYNQIVCIPTPGKSNNYSEVIEINYQQDTLIINHPGGFYKNQLSLKLSNKYSQNIIRYTLDGELPEDDSPIFDLDSLLLNDLTSNENRFANIPKTIKEPGNNIFKGNILRATVYSEGCPASTTISNVYFINEDIQNKYKVPVVSIITEEDNLFNKETGIYVKGHHNNYQQKGKAWERLAHVEIFNANKELIVDQDAGIRINGQGSRLFPQKPFRLYARTEYGKEFFKYPFFRQKQELNKFRTLVLRSTQGLTGTLFKDELTQQLVRNMNIDYSGSQTCIVFINGEYWGIYSLRERLDEGYIENNFGVNNPQPNIISHAVSKIDVSEGSIDDYNNLINYLEYADASSSEYFEKVSELIDIPELIDYYIAQIYFANYDFPQNNLKMWKLNTVDSKWRFFFYDCDACMTNIEQDQLSEYNSDLPLTQKFEDWSKLIFKHLLQNEEFRIQFHKAFNYHIQNTFDAVSVLEEIHNFEELYEPLVGEHTYRWAKPENYIMWKNNLQLLNTFATRRPEIINAQLNDNFGKPYTIYPNPSNGRFSIDFLNEFSNTEVKIYNIQGVLLENRLIDNAIANSFNLNIPEGIYLIQIKLGNTFYTEKIAFYK